MLGTKLEKMEALRARIEQIEKRPLLAEGAALLRQGRDQDLLSTPGGLLHEIFSDEQRNGGAALGFALAQARGLLSAERPALLCMQLVREAQEMGLPYGAGLKSFGLDPDSVVLTRAENIVELLWAIEEAVSCRAVAARFGVAVSSVVKWHQRYRTTGSVAPSKIGMEASITAREESGIFSKSLKSVAVAVANHDAVERSRFLMVIFSKKGLEVEVQYKSIRMPAGGSQNFNFKAVKDADDASVELRDTLL